MQDKLDVQQRFIELRAKGNSYDKIAKTLRVSKSTLLAWSKDLEMSIDNERNMAMDALVEKHKLARQHQMEMLGIQLNNVRQEMEKRDLSAVPTDKLLAMQMKLLDAVNNNGITVTFKARANGWAEPLFDDTTWNG
jgi:orotate phosphoribosyltransferase-like protein